MLAEYEINLKMQFRNKKINNSTMNIIELYELFFKHPVVTTDSRKCPSGSIFFALKGDNFDGNLFAEKALSAGCAYAIVDDENVVKSEQYILTDNVLETLQQLARHHRRTLGTKVIAITGTNGKTTTKELTAAVLSEKYKVLYTQGNLNNHIGVPLTLLRLTKEHEIAVVEMGANHPGEIRELCGIAEPDYGLITNVGHAHLEGFGSFEGVIKTKGELYDFIRERKGYIFVNQENEHLIGMTKELKTILYGQKLKKNTLVAGTVLESNPLLSFNRTSFGHDSYTVKTNLVGSYNLWNVLAAISIGLYFDVEDSLINKAISEYQPTNNRSQFKETAHNKLIIDAYNANPSSMGAALENFGSMDVSPKAVILGDMLELGEKSLELHKELLNKVISYGFEKVFLCGKNFSLVGEGLDCFENVENLIEYLKNVSISGFYILIKGSNGIRLEKIVDLL
jgi:UDP-N-acetylmuramoyl-tripeptide--D-alanyl-D-alanine ligase